MIEVRPAGFINSKAGFMSIVGHRPKCKNNPVFLKLSQQACSVCNDNHGDFVFRTGFSNRQAIKQLVDSELQVPVGVLIQGDLQAESDVNNFQFDYSGLPDELLLNDDDVYQVQNLHFENVVFVYDPMNYGTSVVSVQLEPGLYDAFVTNQLSKDNNIPASLLLLRSDLAEFNFRKILNRPRQQFHTLEIPNEDFFGAKAALDWPTFWREFSPRYNFDVWGYEHEVGDIEYFLENENLSLDCVWTFKRFSGTINYLHAIVQGFDPSNGKRFIVTERPYFGHERHIFSISSVVETLDDWYGDRAQLADFIVRDYGLGTVGFNRDLALIRFKMNPNSANHFEALSWLLQDWTLEHLNHAESLYLYAGEELRQDLFTGIPRMLERSQEFESLEINPESKVLAQLQALRWLPQDLRHITLHREGK